MDREKRMRMRHHRAAATPVVTAFLEYDGKILLLRRSDRVRTYRGLWAGVSGYLEHHTALEQALIEIREETGLQPQDLSLASQGIPLQVVDDTQGVRWRVHPFLFHCREAPVLQIDWEHREHRWIDPLQIDEYDTVPALKQALRRCLQARR